MLRQCSPSVLVHAAGRVSPSASITEPVMYQLPPHATASRTMIRPGASGGCGSCTSRHAGRTGSSLGEGDVHAATTVNRTQARAVARMNGRLALLGGLRGLLDDALGHLAHREPVVHRRTLDPLERLRFGHPVLG